MWTPLSGGEEDRPNPLVSLKKTLTSRSFTPARKLNAAMTELGSRAVTVESPIGKARCRPTNGERRYWKGVSSGWAGSAAGERESFGRGGSDCDSCLNPGRQHGLVSGIVPRLMESAVKGSEAASRHRPVWEQILLYPGIQELER